MKIKLDEALVIGDVAGNYKTLLALIEKSKVPLSNIVCLGDLIDRGPNSKDVVNFIRDNKIMTIKGNHEDMMVSDIKKNWVHSGPGDWEWNGGDATLASFDNEIPKDIVAWVDDLPLWIELECKDKNYFLSHAPVGSTNYLPLYGTEKDKASFLWNRREADKPLPGYDLQIFGHNSHYGLKYIGNPPWCVCIDTSRSDVLTGLHLPSGKIFQQEYID